MMTCLPTARNVESPSLRTAEGAGPAYELKFLLDEAAAREVEAWAQRHLVLDPHGDPALDGAYRTTSLYLDTPQLDVYHGTPSYKRRKFRVRRYGLAGGVFLERKAKWGDRVAKRRTALAEAELAMLAHPMSLVSWPGHWFHRRLRVRNLGPACRIAYERTAYLGAGAEGPLRLTLDRRPRGMLTSEWTVAAFDGGLPLLPGQVILEFKFRTALPTPFKQLVAELRLSPRTVSKYRLCRAAWGAPSQLREVADA